MAQKKASFSQVLSSLQDADAPFQPVYLHLFSDLSDENLNKLNEIWDKVSDERKINLYGDLNDLAHSDYTLNFSAMSNKGLKDKLPQVRTSAIGMKLGLEEPDLKTADELIRMMKDDPDMDVRTAAIEALSEYVLGYEYDEIPEKCGQEVISALKEALNSKDKKIRLAAMSALSFTETEEVPSLIREALHNGETEDVLYALTAIERSLDSKWDDDVLAYLDHPVSRIQMRAVHTAGVMGIKEALGFLYGIVAAYDEQPHELVEQAIEAIAEMTSPDVVDGSQEILEALRDARNIDDDFRDEIEEALGGMTIMMEGVTGMEQPFQDLAEFESDRPLLRGEALQMLKEMKNRCLETLQSKVDPTMAEENDDNEDYTETDEIAEMAGEKEDKSENGEHHHEGEESEEEDLGDDPFHLHGLDVSDFRVIDDLKKEDPYADIDDEAVDFLKKNEKKTGSSKENERKQIKKASKTSERKASPKTAKASASTKKAGKASDKNSGEKNSKKAKK